MSTKICIFPSSELTTVFGKISRQAAYLVCEKLRPGKTVLGCMPALFRGVQEDIEFVENYPVITLEGHPRHNVDRLTKEYPQKYENIVIDVAQILREKNIDLSDSTPPETRAKWKKSSQALGRTGG